jgi:predicted amidohydrolase
MSVKVAVLQIDCSTSESVSQRVERVLHLIDQQAADCDFMVLPELWNVGAFDLAASREHAQPIDGPLPTALALKARENGIWLHGGSFCEQDGDALHNTSVLFNPQGELAAYYRKVHVFTYAREHDTMAAGRDYVIVETPLGLTGLATCYDARFPEMFRAMRVAGAQAFVIPSGWPVPRIGQWDALLPARAVENQAWVIACNQVGAQGTHHMGGHSVIIDPLGKVLANGGETQTVLNVEIDPQIGTDWRTEFPAIDDIVDCPVITV